VSIEDELPRAVDVAEDADFIVPRAVPVAHHRLVGAQAEEEDLVAGIVLVVVVVIEDELADTVDIAEHADRGVAGTVPIARYRSIGRKAVNERRVTGIDLVIVVGVENPGAVAEYTELRRVDVKQGGN